MYKDLTWNFDNFNFWYDGYDQRKFSKFSNEEYNEKFRTLIDNDLENTFNLDILDKKFEKLVKERVTYKFLIEKEKEIIYRELEDIKVDIFDFFEEFSKKSSLCFINIMDSIEQYNEDDSTIFISVNGIIQYVLLPNGEIVPYDEEQFGIPSDNDIIIPQEQLDDGVADFCSTKEVILEGGVYEFC